MSTNPDRWNHFQKLVLKLVKSGDEEPNKALLKEVKLMCKNKQVVIPDVFTLLLKQLEANHCQIRISSFQLIDELFQRSHEFRELTLSKLKQLVSLTLALESGEHLPLPSKFHKDLKKLVIKSIDTWNTKFGAHYRKLRLSHSFLRTQKRVDFKRLIAQSEFEYHQHLKKQESDNNIKQYNVNRTLAVFDEKLDFIKDCIFSANSCFRLLIPDVLPMDTIEAAATSNENNSPKSSTLSEQEETNEGRLDDLKSHGIHKCFELSVTVDFTKRIDIQESADNSSIIQNLDDRIHQAEKTYIPQLNSWIETLIKNGSQQRIVLPVIKTKEKLSIIVKKYNELNISRTSKRKRRIVQKDVDEEEDCDFEEVNDDEVLRGMAEEKRLKLTIDQTSSSLVPTVADDEVPGPSSSEPNYQIHNTNKMKEVFSKSQDEIDEEELELHKMALIKFESLHRFWSTKEIDTEDLNIDTVRALNPSYTDVPGRFEPVKWSCRTPLKSGTLCPRMDRYKCPFHGKVIPRDEAGKPSKTDIFNNTDILVAAQSSSAESWKDVESEVERVTGEKLNYAKIKKRKEKEPTNLVNIKKAPVTPRDRIEKKIFDKRAIKNANIRADTADATRNSDRFGQQFNYALK